MADQTTASQEWGDAKRAAQIALMVTIKDLAGQPAKVNAETAREYAEAFARLQGH